jgi:hypothetical protein
VGAELSGGNAKRPANLTAIAEVQRQADGTVRFRLKFQFDASGVILSWHQAALERLSALRSTLFRQ